MIRVSSAWTLVLKLFIPIFYAVFMGAWTVTTIYIGDEVSPVFEHWLYRISMIVLYTLGVLFFISTTWKLKRLDASSSHLYVTDYFKTFSYSLDSIAEIRPISLLIFNFLKIRLKEKGSMGDQFYVLIEKSVWEQYVMAHPEILSLVPSSR